MLSVILIVEEPGWFYRARGNATAINAVVPLANMFGYINNLRSSTQGRAQYTMQFSL